MSFLKKLSYWLAAGVMLGVGFTVALYYTPRVLYQKQTDKEFIADYKAEREATMGVSCAQVESAARQFITDSVRPVVDAGRSGQDWVALSNPAFLDRLDTLENQTMTCRLIKSNADRVGLEMDGDFKSLHSLFSTLEIFMTSYNDEPPTMRSLKLGAFEIVEDLYRKATNDLSK